MIAKSLVWTKEFAGTLLDTSYYRNAPPSCHRGRKPFTDVTRKFRPSADLSASANRTQEHAERYHGGLHKLDPLSKNGPFPNFSAQEQGNENS